MALSTRESHFRAECAPPTARVDSRRDAFDGCDELDSCRCGENNLKEMALNTCEFRIGRLMEIRVAGGYRTPADVDEMIQMMVDRVSKLPADQKYIIAADWRSVTVMSPETATRVRTMLSKSNARVVRSSILTTADQSTANLQVERLVREAENENRRHFVYARDQYKWLSEVLTPVESRRLADFLGLTGRSIVP